MLMPGRSGRRRDRARRSTRAGHRARAAALLVIWVYVAVVASRMAMGHVRGAFEATLDFVPVVMYFLFVDSPPWTRVR
jgi:hypothetical protein